MLNAYKLKRLLTFLVLCIGMLGFTACAAVTTGTTTTKLIDLPVATNVENFGNYEELKTYLSSLYDYDATNDSYVFKNAGSLDIATTTAAAGIFDGVGANETAAEVDRTHSETNNQVEGVSEYDTVLTDGYHIYISTWQHFFIVNADTLAIEYTYAMENGYINGLFFQDGRIILLAYEYTYTEAKTSEDAYYWYHYSYGAKIVVFDVTGVSDTVAPTIEKELFFDNSYLVDARMIDGYVYLIMDNYTINYGFNEDAFVPVYRDSAVGEADISLPASNIYVMPNDNYSIEYLLLVSFSVAGEEAAVVNAYLGSSWQIFMSENNLYVVMYRYTYDPITWFYDYTTYILRFQIDGDHSLVYQATGIVDGSPLNQFSMDEYDGTFRIATTGYSYTETSWSTENALYVLDATSIEVMTPIGHLGGLGKPNERIYSCRFDGVTAYIVTFVQTDPMYQIDLTDPANPVVAAELFDEGVSDYLHLMGNGLILGVGRQSVTTDGWTRFVGVKVELYRSEGDDLTSIEQYLAEGEYSYTNVSWDHKAFMSFTPEGADFTYVTVPIYEYNNDYYSSSQNLYVFKVFAAGDLELVAKLSHMDENLYGGWCWYFDSIERAVIIGTKIFTVSNYKIQMFDMAEEFAFVAKTELESGYYWYRD